MKKLLIICFLFFAAGAYSQTKKDPYPTVEKIRADCPNACHVYKSAEDYYANKPIPNMDWRPIGMSFGGKIEVIKNGTVEKTKLKEMGDYWLSDEQGFLMRPYKKDFYTVVVNGAICYYVQHGNGEVFRNADSTLSFNSSWGSDKYFDYSSETLKGDIKEWKDKVLTEYLKQYGLLEQYDSEKVKAEKHDSAMSWESRKINKKLRYLKIVNEKLGKKG